MDSNPDQDQNPNLKYQKYLGFKKGVLFFVPHFFLADVPHYFQPLIPDVPHYFQPLIPDVPHYFQPLIPDVPHFFAN